MRNGVAYRNYLIRGESFQRENHGAWVPQYTLTRQESGDQRTGFPSHQYQFNEAFPTEVEADEFALRRAREWVDKS